MIDIKQLDKKTKAELLTGKNYWQSQTFPQTDKFIYFSDGPSGLRVQKDKADNMGLNKSEPATCFPSHSSLACSWDLELIKNVGSLMGVEATHYGVNVLLAPGINIKRSPLCGRNFEYFSEDPYLSGMCGGAFVSGVQEKGVGSCVKHFAANNKEYGRMISDSQVDERTLREIYLTSFEVAIKTGKPVFVMTAYNLLNGTYCNESSELIGDILRGEWGYEGAVVSDWGGTYDRIAAVKAGADIEMPGFKLSASQLLKAVDDGELKESEIDSCVERLYRAVDRLNPTDEACDFSANSEYAKYCAENSAVLLKNDGVLPIQRESKVALVGEYVIRELYQGLGSSHVNPTSRTCVINYIKKMGSYVGFSMGYNENEILSKKLIKMAVGLAQKAQTIILYLGSQGGAHEGMDREGYSLPENQIELLKALSKLDKKIVVVLATGSPIDMSWDEYADAVLYVGLNGQGGSSAIAKLLYGEANPSGKLAETILKDFSLHRANEYFNVSQDYTVYGEGMKVGYRADDDDNVKYPFGFGLSYTKFSYSDILVSERGVKFTLRNVGEVDGSEIAQLYVGFPEMANTSKRQLKGFKKVSLKAGESREVFIPFDEFTFRSYDIENKKWVIVKGDYRLLICSSSRDICLESCIIKDGVDTVKAAECKRDLVKPSKKKEHIVVTLSTPFGSLVKSRSWRVRTFSRLALFFTRRNPTVGGSLAFAPIRMGAQFLNFNASQAEGLVDTFNGKIWRGCRKMIKYRQKRLDRIERKKKRSK